jgi:prepilin-type processing-associated H-X9-DG protein/prepilin-type N-terminal cleavage/methylation domain-containing protein
VGPGLSGRKPSHLDGFTLLELLTVVGVISILAALLLPVVARGKASAQTLKCLGHLRQLTLATQMYWDDNGSACFRYGGVSTNGGHLYWFGWMGPGAEGERDFDAAQGVLFPYLQGRGIELCPAFSYVAPTTKLKARGASFGYGYNLYLSAGARQAPVKTSRIMKPSNLALLGDAAQVNTWQAPASPSNPMLEEWYYIDASTNQPNGHFRHAGKGNAAFCDGHAAKETFVPGSVDTRMPAQRVALFRPEILVLP